MIKNYFLIALRTFKRQPGYSLINIIGLAVGICCCALVMRYVYEEFSFDQHHPHVDRTYRFIRETRIKSGDPSFSSGIDGPLSARVAESIPEVEKAVRFYSRGCWMNAGEKRINRQFLHAEDGFLDLFSFPLKEGDVENLKCVKNGILITEQTAQMFFGDESPMGKVISTEWKYIVGDYVVVGVVENMPKNTDLRFDILTMTEHQGYWMQRVWSNWRPQSGFHPIRSFLRLQEGADVSVVEAKIAHLVKDHYDADYVSKNTIHLQGLDRMHLYSNADYGMRSGGDIAYVYMMSLSGLFILLVACINYVNLATARSATRALEIGLRKVVGANRSHLVRQFIGESVLVVGVAALLGFTLGELAKPYVAPFIGRPLFMELDFLTFLGAVVVCAVLLGGIAGCYPAFFLSRYQPAVVVKGRTEVDSKGGIRKGLVVLQFVISIALISGVLIVKQQVDYMQNKNLGFNSDQIIVTRLFNNGDLRKQWRSVKARFLQHTNITTVSATSTHPGVWVEYWRMRPEGKEPWRVFGLSIDEDFMDMYGVQLLEGRNVSVSDPVADGHEFLLNASAVRALGWEGQAIGKRLTWEGATNPLSGVVVGVVADFHTESLHAKIQPVILCKYPRHYFSCSFKVRGDQVEHTLAFMKETWEDLWPGVPFNYTFLDVLLDSRYRQEQRTGEIFQLLAAIAIFVACLGLVGLSTYTVQQRSKEIGIRKVLGASVPDITLLLFKEVLTFVVVANLIAWPLAYYIMSNWLETFAYRIDVGIETFVMGGLFALFIALASVGHQTLKAALANPVDALKCE